MPRAFLFTNKRYKPEAVSLTSLPEVTRTSGTAAAAAAASGSENTAEFRVQQTCPDDKASSGSLNVSPAALHDTTTDQEVPQTGALQLPYQPPGSLVAAASHPLNHRPLAPQDTGRSLTFWKDAVREENCGSRDCTGLLDLTSSPTRPTETPDVDVYRGIYSNTEPVDFSTKSRASPIGSSSRSIDSSTSSYGLTPSPSYNVRTHMSIPNYEVSPQTSSPNYDVSPQTSSPNYDVSPQTSSPNYDVSPQTSSPNYDVSPQTSSPNYDVSPSYDISPPYFPSLFSSVMEERLSGTKTPFDLGPPTPSYGQDDMVFNPNLSQLNYSLNALVEKAWSEINVADTHVCPECGKRYSTSSNLARHRQTHRSMTDKKARKCPHCDKVYVSMPAFSMHVRTHNQGCECPYCGKRFSRPWLLQGHIRTHTGEKPFKCPQCSKAFADKSNLRAHVQTHSADKPFVCERCGKAFALKSYLYKHEESSCMRGQHQRPYRVPQPGVDQ